MSHYFSGDVLALEAHGLKPVGSSPSGSHCFIYGTVTFCWSRFAIDSRGVTGINGLDRGDQLFSKPSVHDHLTLSCTDGKRCSRGCSNHADFRFAPLVEQNPTHSKIRPHGTIGLLCTLSLCPTQKKPPLSSRRWRLT